MADEPKAQRVKQPAGRTKLITAGAIVAVLALGGATLAYVLTKSSSPGASGAIGAAGVTPTTQGLTLLVQPPDGSTDVAPDTIVSVTATTGHINAVTVASAAGGSVVGALSSGGTAWRSTGLLALKSDYTITVDGTLPNGRPTQEISHFQSLVPAATLGVTVTPSTGLTVGVAQPIVFRFDHAVVNKDALVAALQITQSNPVSGGWHWFSTKELHYRPQAYWPTGEQVTVKANLDGFNAGNGVWGTGSINSKFTVGDAHISTVNVATDMMTVTSNGAVVATYPVSAGRTQYPTMNGIHIDLYRQQDVHMVSSTVGIPVNSPDGYDEHVYWDVNISDGGEFVHAAPWSTGAQGNSNVSHGCVNLSVENATAFFNFSRIGDVIEVTGSPRGPDLGDHGTMDWNLAWSSWTPATA